MRDLYKSDRYYISLPLKEGKNFEEKYWREITDPDGKVRNRAEEREQFLKDIDYILKYLKNLHPGRILDIGCGLGWLLSAINEKWNKYGLEISKIAAEFAAKYGEIFYGPLLKSNYPDNFFDVIVMHHVIEHMENPVENLKIIKQILKPDGILILGTPDFDSGCARLFGQNYRLLHDETHISLFSNDSMHRFLRDNNFKILEVEYPFFHTRFFNQENLTRMFEFNKNKISPPFYGNFMTFFCKNKK